MERTEAVTGTCGTFLLDSASDLGSFACAFFISRLSPRFLIISHWPKDIVTTYLIISSTGNLLIFTKVQSN